MRGAPGRRLRSRGWNRRTNAAVWDWSLAPSATLLMVLRGIEFIAATTSPAEIGDLTLSGRRRELMAWLGTVPSDHSICEWIRRGAIEKLGNRRARRCLVECGWKELPIRRWGRLCQCGAVRGGAARAARHRRKGGVRRLGPRASGAAPPRQAACCCCYWGPLAREPAAVWCGRVGSWRTRRR